MMRGSGACCYSSLSWCFDLLDKQGYLDKEAMIVVAGEKRDCLALDLVGLLGGLVTCLC